MATAIYTNAAETIVSWQKDDGSSSSFMLGGDTPDHREFQEWLDAGNTIAPYVAPTIDAVARIQFYKQLKAINKLSQIRTLASTWAADSDARIEWEAGGMIAKTGPLVTAIKAELGLTNQQVNTFFANAAVL